jgi:hypothetical protein
LLFTGSGGAVFFGILLLICGGFSIMYYRQIENRIALAAFLMVCLII